MKKKTILLIALMVISVGFLSGCNEQTDINTENEDSSLRLWVYGDGTTVSISVNGGTVCYKRYIDGFEYFTYKSNRGNNEIEVTHHIKGINYYLDYLDDRIETKTVYGNRIEIDVTWSGGITIKGEMI